MKKEGKTLHDHRIISHNLLFVGFVILLSAFLFQHTNFVWILLVLGFLIMMVSVLYASKFLKCPHCGTKFDPRMKVPHFCPNCGKQMF